MSPTVREKKEEQSEEQKVAADVAAVLAAVSTLRKHGKVFAVVMGLGGVGAVAAYANAPAEIEKHARQIEALEKQGEVQRQTSEAQAKALAQLAEAMPYMLCVSRSQVRGFDARACEALDPARTQQP